MTDAGGTARLTCRRPFDLGLSWKVYDLHGAGHSHPAGRFATWWDGVPTLVSLEPDAREPGVIHVGARPSPEPSRPFAYAIRSMVNAGLDLGPFYRLASGHPVLERLTVELEGLKPFKPPDLFSMLVIAITEQQISMTAAHSIRARFVRGFGTPVGDLFAYPRPRDVEGVSVERLKSIGLSRRKAEYIREIARMISSGEIEPESWRGMKMEELAEELGRIPGVGEWTIEYLMVRGLGNYDVVPATDLGIKRVVGSCLGEGDPASPEEVEELLERWSPYRGLAVFYLVAGDWLERGVISVQSPVSD